MRILVADDHPLYLEAVSLRLGRVFPEARIVQASGLDALLAADRGGEPPALILLDLRMPGMDARAALERVVAAYPGAPVALMSGSASPEDIRGAVKAGARGFLPKTMPPDAFSALAVLAAGGTYLPAEALLDPGPAPDEKEEARRALESRLTPKEREVLVGLVTGASNKEIARDLHLAEVTVKLHVRQILKKIGAKNRAGAAAVAVRSGLI